jgi:hypothetical protein
LEKIKKMQATNLQMVEIDHKQFAVELSSGNVHVNLTHLSKPFGTDPKQWLRTDESKAYLKALSILHKCRMADLLKVRRGGIPGTNGTWALDYRIAMRFAQWLSPEFSVSVDDLLLKLMRGSAVVAEPIAGIWPIIENGKIGYPRKEILEAAKLSPRSGSVSYWKALYPDDHFTIYRTACVSQRFANMRLKAGQYRQLRLDFNKKGGVYGDN